MHSSKGLEFPVVFIPGLGFMYGQKAELEREARLLYVAMTRATEQLFISGTNQATFVQQLFQAQRGHKTDSD